MQELFRLLCGTKDPVYVEYQGVGVSYKFYEEIISYEIYQDGLEIFFDGEGSMFISSIINEVINVKTCEDYTEYVLSNRNYGALINIKVWN